MKIIEKTVQEISLDAKDLETKEIIFSFKCGSCYSHFKIRLCELVGGEPISCYCSKGHQHQFTPIGLDIKCA